MSSTSETDQRAGMVERGEDAERRAAKGGDERQMPKTTRTRGMLTHLNSLPLPSVPSETEAHQEPVGATP